MPRPAPPSAEPYTVHREAQVYRAIAGAGLRAPRLIAEHPRLQAVLTSRAPGIAEFRRLSDTAEKQAIACDLMDTLACLHRIPATGIALDGGGHGPRIAGHVRAELGIWQAMYAEAGRTDPLIDLAFRWLDGNMPDPDGPVALVHSDAGPGNFLFEHGRMTALIDWELAHLGDPMEDLAWLSMRCVMEPVPDFSGCLREYERRAGSPVDRAHPLPPRVRVHPRRRHPPPQRDRGARARHRIARAEPPPAGGGPVRRRRGAGGCARAARPAVHGIRRAV